MEIQGYRELSEAEISWINKVKDAGNLVKEMIAALDVIAKNPGTASIEVDPRWLAIAATHLQEGFMFVTRAIARPEGF